MCADECLAEPRVFQGETGVVEEDADNDDDDVQEGTRQP